MTSLFWVVVPSPCTDTYHGLMGVNWQATDFTEVGKSIFLKIWPLS